MGAIRTRESNTGETSTVLAARGGVREIRDILQEVLRRHGLENEQAEAAQSDLPRADVAAACLRLPALSRRAYLSAAACTR